LVTKSLGELKVLIKVVTRAENESNRVELGVGSAGLVKNWIASSSSQTFFLAWIWLNSSSWTTWFDSIAQIKWNKKQKRKLLDIKSF